MKKKFVYKVLDSYKDYDITLFGMFITVQYCGDEIVFNSVEEARKFIDEVTE